MARGARDEYGILHSAEHVDLILFIAATRLPGPLLARLPVYWDLIFFLAAAMFFSLADGIRDGNSFRLLLGSTLLLFADWYIYKVGYLGLGVTVLYLRLCATDARHSF